MVSGARLPLASSSSGWSDGKLTVRLVGVWFSRLLAIELAAEKATASSLGAFGLTNVLFVELDPEVSRVKSELSREPSRARLRFSRSAALYVTMSPSRKHCSCPTARHQ